MRAMILAAGRGVRMGDLTRDVPKPLLKIAGKYLIEYSIEALAKFGIKDIVINLRYRGEQIQAALGAGERYGVNLHYSEEKEALETGGGVFQALPLLGSEPFIVVSSDVITAYPLEQLPKNPTGLAHLVLVDNPDFHPQGDFCIIDNYLAMTGAEKFTFGNIGVYRPELFSECEPGFFRLGDLIKRKIANQQITGEHYTGFWHNLGTPEQLAELTEKSDLLK